MLGSIVPLTGAAAFWASVLVGMWVATCAACIGIFFFTKRGKRQVLKLADHWIPMPRHEDEEHRWDEADGSACTGP